MTMMMMIDHEDAAADDDEMMACGFVDKDNLLPSKHILLESVCLTDGEDCQNGVAHE